MSLALAAFVVAVAAAPVQAAPVTRTCGLLPGEGAFSYVKTRGVSCRDGWKISRRAHRRFCRRHDDCLLQGSVATTKIYAGKVRYRGWRCKVKDGWELSVTRCRRGRQRIFQKSAA